MKNIIQILILAFVAIATTACVTSNGCRIPGQQPLPPTNPDLITVYYLQPPTRPYVILGDVTVHRAIAGSDEANERKFKTVAATMGADAVIVDAIPEHSYFTDVPGKGKAIKWTYYDSPFASTIMLTPVNK